jgi:hypothetical protein
MHDAYEGAMNNIGQPAEPKPELVECAIVELLDIAQRHGIIVELLDIAQRHGITPADFIQLLDSGMRISDFLAAMKSPTNANDSIDCDS